MAAIIGAILKAAPMVMGMIGDKKNKDEKGSGDGMKKASGGVSAIAPAVMGLTQSIQGRMKRKEADNMQPQEADPQVRMQLDKIQRQAQALKSGTMSSTIGQQLQQTGTSARLNALKIGGISGLSAANRAGDSVANALVQLNAKNQAAGLEMDKLATQQIDKIAGRRLGIQRARYAQKLLEAEELRKAGSQNIMASIGAIGGKVKEPNSDLLGTTADGAAAKTTDVGATADGK